MNIKKAKLELKRLLFKNILLYIQSIFYYLMIHKKLYSNNYLYICLYIIIIDNIFIIIL